MDILHRSCALVAFASIVCITSWEIYMYLSGVGRYAWAGSCLLLPHIQSNLAAACVPLLFATRFKDSIQLFFGRLSLGALLFWSFLRLALWFTSRLPLLYIFPPSLVALCAVALIALSRASDDVKSRVLMQHRSRAGVAFALSVIAASLAAIFPLVPNMGVDSVALVARFNPLAGAFCFVLGPAAHLWITHRGHGHFHQASSVVLIILFGILGLG